MVKVYRVCWQANRRTNEGFTRCGEKIVVSDSEYNAIDAVAAIINKKFGNSFDFTIVGAFEIPAIVAL